MGQLIHSRPSSAKRAASVRPAGRGGLATAPAFALLLASALVLGGATASFADPGDSRPPPHERRNEGRGSDRRVEREAAPRGDPPEQYREQRREDSLGAGWRPQQDEARRGVREGRLMPLGRVIDQIRRYAPGRQLDAGIETDAYGRSVYRVRWAGADGRRSDYIVDAETGRILGVDGR
jgi:Peptidase propeptide and YPEB domain